jgi:hypothetical protein
MWDKGLSELGGNIANKFTGKEFFWGVFWRTCPVRFSQVWNLAGLEKGSCPLPWTTVRQYSAQRPPGGSAGYHTATPFQNHAEKGKLKAKNFEYIANLYSLTSNGEKLGLVEEDIKKARTQAIICVYKRNEKLDRNLFLSTRHVN